ncbi:unnamed protein product [Rotaria magnacalcarata]|uniref:Uncharacterized protein n=4 Tax=Rotaria TaxID=231623 RepID=A0A8S2JQB6_9BILA|nr:unnamed protein product [Rotaria magnacalcarata]
MKLKKKKKTNAACCQKYRQKIKLKRLQSKHFDKKIRKKESTRKAMYRTKIKQRQQQEQSILSTSTITISRNNLRKIEGRQRRRQNASKLKSDEEKLQDSNKKLENENRRLKAQLASLLISSSSTPPEATTGTRTTTSSSNFLFNNLSPGAKKRAAARMRREKQNLARGTMERVHNEFGINLSNNNLASTGTVSTSKELASAIEQFIINDEITRLTPDKKQIIDGQQVRLLLNHLINLHQRFIHETRYDCSFSTFTRHVPSYIVSPKPHEWGTCLCMSYLNPQIKSERINQLKNSHPILNNLSTLLNDDITSVTNDKNKVEEILKELDSLKNASFTITYTEWIKKKSEKEPSRTYGNGTCSIQSAYYYEQQVSISAGYVLKKNNCFSFDCLSDETRHMAEYTWVAIRDLQDELLDGTRDGKVSELNFISDLPSSQYRNKTTIYLLKHYATIRKITIRWLFLGSGHGKGISDTIGSSIKRLFDDAIRLNPDESFNAAEELMNKIKGSTNIRLYLYKKEDVDSFLQQIPSLTTVKGTSMFHELIAKPNGQIFAKNKSDEQETLLQTKF